jgi:hypothetical protein
MSEEVQNLAAISNTAPEQEVTATTQFEDIQAPEVTEGTQEEIVAEKKFSQEDLDAAIGKRLAREQRKWEREQTARQAEMQVRQSVPRDIPSADHFNSPEDYAEALAYKRAEELVQQREYQKQQAIIAEAYQDREEEARNKYDDFEQVAYNTNLRITDAMAETIRASDVGPDVAYYLGANPKEADRIARLTPLLQAREIGKIEVKVTDNPPVKKTSSAPAPISPVTARGNSGKSYDTTDSRSIKDMSTSEWIEAERARQIKKWEAQRNR